MDTFMLIHITDTDRFLTTDSPELLVNFEMTAGGKAKFMFDGTIYEVCDVVHNFYSGESTGQRLLALLSALTGSEEKAAGILERSESLTDYSEVTVTRNDDGTISASIYENFRSAVCVAQAAPLQVLEDSLFGGDPWAPSTDGIGMTALRGNSGPRDC